MTPAPVTPRQRTLARLRWLGLAVGLPLLLTAVLFGPTGNDEQVRPTAAYLVLVVAATAVSGLWAGVVSWAVSTLCLWFVVLRPKHDLVLDEADDTIAVVVFLVTTAIGIAVVNALRNDRLRLRAELRRRQLAEAEVRHAADRAHLLQHLAERMSAESEVGALAQVVVDHCRDGLDAASVGVLLHDPETDDLVLEAAVGDPSPTAAAWRQVPLSADLPVAVAARERRAVVVQSPGEWRRLFPHAALDPADEFQARCALPLVRTSGELLGALVVSWVDARELGEDDRTLMSTIASLCESSLERAKLREERERSRFASALEAMVDPVAILRAVRDDDGVVTDFLVEFSNQPRDDDGLYPEGFVPLVGRLFTDLYDSDQARRRFATYAEVVDTAHPARMSGVPITVAPGDERIYDIHVSPFGDGVIVVTRDVTERERAALELAESDARLRAAQRVGHVGSWETDLVTNTNVWSEQLYRMFGAEPGEDTAEVLRRTIGRDADRLRGLVTHVAETGVPMETEYDVRLGEGSPRRFHTRAELHDAPGGSIIRGVVRDITAERALQASVSVLKSDLRDERAAVEVLQRALLPQALPDPPFAEVHATYRPAGENSLVGGDWYDAFMLPSGRLAFTVGDVAGHGMGAASAMSELRHSLRAYARSSPQPSTVLGELDGLFSATGDEPYATCFYAVCEPDGSGLTWSNAGHLPMVLLRGGRTTPVPTQPGAPLGAGLGSYRDESMELEPGDILLLYTDGLVERRTAPIDVGIRELCRAAERLPPLPARDVCERLTAIMLQGSEHDDDVCVLAVGITA